MPIAVMLAADNPISLMDAPTHRASDLREVQSTHKSIRGSAAFLNHQIFPPLRK
ncbi:hypothetical protein CA13_07300 [Planctomycetes bacterium CA13]|uniref:Uncharacterized protein n=1 Tax=Novipirellula herctigrandis TaxID=2527986 RepID=A0A5C5YX99_9BACT|nr:hypothetical protein CA13_07300 [Planctomycetes bacterium CA13]